MDTQITPSSPTDRFTALLIFASDYNDQTWSRWARLNGVSFKRAEGCFRGKREPSYIVNAKFAMQIWGAGFLAGQESVLLLSPQERTLSGKRQAFLLWLTPNGDRIASVDVLGDWRKVPAAEALASEAWTYDPDGDVYYVAGEAAKRLPAPEGASLCRSDNGLAIG